MANSPLTQFRPHPEIYPSAYEQAQLALAVADEPFLCNLLTQSLPAIAHPHEIGAIGIEVGVPLLPHPQPPIDGVLNFERVTCLLAGPQLGRPDPPQWASHSEYLHLTSCQSDLITLAQNVPLSDVIALLAHASFTAEEISQVLQLPSQAWHKSWWYRLDGDGYPTLPFQRAMRSRRFADGTFTLQYQDHYAHEAPAHFRSHLVKLPIIIRDPQDSFGSTMGRVNLARQALSSQTALLIADTLSELEAEGFMRQSVALFTQQAVRLSLAVNCRTCGQENCPLQGVDSSPVVVCRAYQD